MNHGIWRICLLIVAIALPSACYSQPDYSETEIAYHESGHAVYAIASGLYPSQVLMTTDGEFVSCLGSEDPPEALGMVCFSGNFGGGVQSEWHNCSVSAAGRYGVVVGLGYHEGAAHHKTDDKNAAAAAAAILAAKANGESWSPAWPGSALDEEDEPTKSDVLAECHRHARSVIEENKGDLILLAEALYEDPDRNLSTDDLRDLMGEE